MKLLNKIKAYFKSKCIEWNIIESGYTVDVIGNRVTSNDEVIHGISSPASGCLTLRDPETGIQAQLLYTYIEYNQIMVEWITGKAGGIDVINEVAQREQVSAYVIIDCLLNRYGSGDYRGIEARFIDWFNRQTVTYDVSAAFVGKEGHHLDITVKAKFVTEDTETIVGERNLTVVPRSLVRAAFLVDELNGKTFTIYEPSTAVTSAALAGALMRWVNETTVDLAYQLNEDHAYYNLRNKFEVYKAKNKAGRYTKKEEVKNDETK
jgi:hypothetical protein|nr:MAG TPA: hypothetical protein [Caudoviricetes sp.]